MVAEVFAGIGAFKTMFDMAKALKEMDTANTRNMAVIDLQERILAAQSAYAELASRVGELEAVVRSLETWETEKQRYELHKAGYSGFVYRLKEGVQPPEPAHEICANCYEGRKKSILERQTWQPGRAVVLTCQRCGTTAYVSGVPFPEHAKLRHRFPA
jgi:hypothetical protein